MKGTFVASQEGVYDGQQHDCIIRCNSIPRWISYCRIVIQESS